MHDEKRPFSFLIPLLISFNRHLLFLNKKLQFPTELLYK